MERRLSRDRLAIRTRFVWEGSGIVFVYSTNPGHKESRWRLDETHFGVSPQSGIITRAEVTNPRGVSHHGEIPGFSALLTGELTVSPMKLGGEEEGEGFALWN